MTDYTFDNNMSDEEFAKRITKCLIIFTDILPIYDKEHQAAFRLIFGKNIDEIIPKFMYDLSIQISKTREQSTPYLIFLKQALDHALDIDAPMPEVDYQQDKLNKLVEKRIAGLNLDGVTPHIVEE